MSGGGSGKVKETEEEKALARVAGEKWNDYQDRFVPYENEFMSRMEVTDADRDQFKGGIIGQANKSFAESENALLDEQIGKGARPGSGRFQAALNRVMQKRGKSIGYRLTDADNMMDEKRASNLQSVVDLGRGKEMEAYRSMGDLATQAHRDAIADGEESRIRSEGNNQAFGNVIGGAARVWGNKDDDGD